MGFKKRVIGNNHNCKPPIHFDTETTDIGSVWECDICGCYWIIEKLDVYDSPIVLPDGQKSMGYVSWKPFKPKWWQKFLNNYDKVLSLSESENNGTK
jgi:hypothetical protein